jgi:excisionase family DNA binding protein
MTVAEIAQLVKLDQAMIQEWIDAGTLPSIPAGRRIRVRREDLDDLIESECNGRVRSEVVYDLWDGVMPDAVAPGPPEPEQR